jgi:hypothetical protein
VGVAAAPHWLASLSRNRYRTGRPFREAGSKRQAFAALTIIDVDTLGDGVNRRADSTSPLAEITSSSSGRLPGRTPGGGSLGTLAWIAVGGTTSRFSAE